MKCSEASVLRELFAQFHHFACKGGGNVLDFVARKEGVGLRDAALLLCERFDLPMGNSPAVQSNKSKRESGARKPPEGGTCILRNAYGSGGGSCDESRAIARDAS